MDAIITPTLLLLSVILFLLANRIKKKSGLPEGRIIYTDTYTWGNKTQKPLYDPQLNLVGKPDYLVQSQGKIIPVEVKSSPAPESPYDSHIFQLAAYCLLVEKCMGTRPPYGIIHYSNRDFAIDYTPDLKKKLLAILEDMHQDQTTLNLPRSHNNPARCTGCGYRTSCDQKL